MGSRRFRHPVRGKVRAGLACAFILCALFMIHAGPSSAATQVLVINSYHSGLTWTDSIMDGIRETFSRSGRDIQLSAEYLDARRYVDPGRARMIRELITAKLEGSRPDIVMVSDNAALEFVLAERDRLFRDIPVIFLGINHFEPSMIAKYPKITGVAEDLSVAETVALALKLHPGTRKIVVVGRTSVPADRANREAFVSAMREPPREVTVSYWDDLPVAELKERLLKLESGSILFLNGLMTDEAGRQMMYGETTSWVRRHSAVPVYSFWSVYLGYGIVGGKLVSAKEQGRRAAELALAVLGGTDTARLPVISASDANQYMFDYREIERFRIPMSELPKGSQFINRPDSIYHTHRGFILASAAVVLMLSGLVILFIILMVRSRRAEEALRKANLVVENSSATLFRWKAAEGWPVQWVSGNVIQFGYTPEDLRSGRVPYLSIIHPDDRERVGAEVAAHSAGGAERFAQEYRIVTKGGDVRWVYDRTAVERDASGKIAGYEGIIVDVTEQKEAERKLREKTEELDRFFTAAIDLLCIADADGCFRRLNPEWEVVLGYPLADLEGRRFLDLVHPDDLQDTLSAMGNLASGSAVINFVNRYRRSDGTYRWIEWRSYPSENLIYAAARDITERKKADEALRKSEEKYRDIFERAVEGIFQSTPDGRFLSVNPSFAGMLGYESPEELINGLVNIPEQMYVHPEERVFFKDALGKSGSVVVGFEHELRRKDGSVIWVSTNAGAVRDGDGTILYYEGTSEDVTERKEAEKEIRRLNEDLERRVRERTAQLEAANKELEAFSYSVSHDLRAPLRAIDGYARIITEDYAPLLDAEGMRVCGVVQENARRMGQLIDDLLSFSRLSRAAMQWLLIDMGTLADSVFHEVTTPETRGRIEFRADHLPGAPGDPTLIRQVWTNLLSNAVKFTSKREKAVIEVGSLSGEDEITYFVRDNGAGFDMRYVEKLFGVFQRLHSEREFEGTGVGLAIVQRVIQRHGGRVWAEGEEGRGAAFFFTLPAKRE